MMNLELRVFRLEQGQAKIQQQMTDVLRRLAALEQKMVNASGGGGGGSGGSSGGFFVCMPGSSVSGATWSAGVPTAGVSFSATVYQVSATAITSLGTKTVYNWLPATLAASKACILVPDATGAYGVVSQSCT